MACHRRHRHNTCFVCTHLVINIFMNLFIRPRRALNYARSLSVFLCIMEMRSPHQPSLLTERRGPYAEMSSESTGGVIISTYHKGRKYTAFFCTPSRSECINRKNWLGQSETHIKIAREVIWMYPFLLSHSQVQVLPHKKRIDIYISERYSEKLHIINLNSVLY